MDFRQIGHHFREPSPPAAYALLATQRPGRTHARI
jgi:hypothetical protein